MNFYQVYNKLPVFFQNFICTLYGYKEARLRYSKDFEKYLSDLIDSDFYNDDQIREYKSKRLQEVLLKAKNHPFYKEKMVELSADLIISDPFKALGNFPILEKKDLLDFNMKSLVNSKNHKIVITSGTTGKALSLCKDKKSFAMQWAVWLRHRKRFNISLGDLSVNFTGKPVVPLNQLTPPFWRFNAAQNQYLISMQHINEKNIIDIIDFLNSIKPSFYSGYPSIIAELSRLAISRKIKLNLSNTPRVIFTGAENLLDYQRDSIISWMGEKVIITDQYGLTEGNCNFSKCEYGNYHEDFEFCHIEIENAVKLSDGSFKGNLIGTAFYNEAMPLIRYNTGDIAVISPKKYKCQCGRHSRVILSVEGRSDDYIVTPDGRHIMRLDYLFKDTFEVIEAQVVQEHKNEVKILAVLAELGNKEDFESKVSAHFGEYISTEMRIIFEYVSKIDKSTTGKFKAVLNKMK